MPRALYSKISGVDVAFTQRPASVDTDIVESVKLSANVEQSDRSAADLHNHPITRRQFPGSYYFYEIRHLGLPLDFAARRRPPATVTNFLACPTRHLTN